MRYIRRVEVASPGTHNEHIIAVAYSYATTGTLIARSRTDVVGDIDVHIESYRTHDDRTGDEATVTTVPSARGIRYLTTLADGRETNNLLSLPRL